MGSSSPQQMPPPPDSTFSAAESITTHDTLPPSKLIARDNVLLAGLLAAFAPSMADAHRLSIDDLHPDRNLLLFLHRLSPHIGTDLTGDWLLTHPALRVSSFFSMYPQPAALAIRRRSEPSSTQGASWRQVLLPNKMSSAPIRSAARLDLEFYSLHEITS